MTAAWRRVLAILAIFLGVFICGRALLLALYPDNFDDLGMLGIAAAFGRGAMFDLSITLVFIGLPLLLMLLPLHWAGGRRWQGVWGWYCFLVLGMFLFIIGADLIYFGVVRRHAGPEVTAISNDLDLLLAMALSDYLTAVLLCAAALVPLFWLWRRLLRVPQVRGVHYAVVVVVFVVMVVLVRGGVVGKPIGVVDAFNGGSSAGGYLTLNGPFTMFHSLLGSEARPVDFMAWEQAVALVQRDLFAAGEVAVNADYPLQRRPVDPPPAALNVVVLMLESWDAAHVDALRVPAGRAPLGATPNFDALSREGALFSQCYASGQRSMDGLSALLAGIPTLPGIPYLGRGMEQNDLSFLGTLARSQGYQSYFLQSARRRSFRVDAIARRAGFEHYLGAEDIPASGHTPAVSERGAWDYDTLLEAQRLFAAAQPPFVGFVFTASTHDPYPLPGEQWRKFAGDGREARYLNTLYYADWALGKFFAAARQSPYYRNTLFILAGDHVSGLDVQANDVRSLHHIPCLVLGPNVQPGVIDHVASQLDVLPTIIDRTHWPVSYASLGRSLFDAGAALPRGAFAVRGDVVTRIEQGGWVTHDLRRRVDARQLKADYPLDLVEQRLLAEVQVAAILLKQNRIYHAE